jgi:N-acetylmuramoyl-L-alanine amidase
MPHTQSASEAPASTWTPPPGGSHSTLPVIPSPLARITGKVVIDAGHGGKDDGTHSAAGVTEKSINLAVALAVAQCLREKGIDVVLTRSNDTFMELAGRTAIANRSGARLFVSIHADYNNKPSMQGHTILLPQNGSAQSSRLANLISSNMVMAGSTKHSVRRDSRGLYVLEHTNCTSLLVELGFLSNRTEAAGLAKATTQTRLGKAIAEGIAQYLQGRS